MAEDFYLDEDGMRGVTGGMRFSGEEMKSAFTDLENGLAPFVGCWGNDEIGKAFEKNYWPNASMMLDGYRPAGDDMVKGADVTMDNVTYFASLDEDNAKWLDSQKPE